MKVMTKVRLVRGRIPKGFGHLTACNGTKGCGPQKSRARCFKAVLVMKTTQNGACHHPMRPEKLAL